MSKKETVKVMVEGGAATPGPPLGPALGPLGVNAGKVVEEINKITASFKGMKVPVEVIVDSATKEFEIQVGTPPTSALLLKALGVEKGGGSKEMIGDLGFDQVMEVAKSKQNNLLANELKSAIKEVVGTCQSLRITINGLTPKEMTQAITSGILDDYINGKTDVLPTLVHHEEKVKIVGLDEEKTEPVKPEAEEEPESKEEKPKEREDKKLEEDKKEKKK